MAQFTVINEPLVARIKRVIFELWWSSVDKLLFAMKTTPLSAPDYWLPWQLPLSEHPEQKLLLILKWGGELTMAGRAQSECMGDSFRSVYPNKNGTWNSTLWNWQFFTQLQELIFAHLNMFNHRKQTRIIENMPDSRWWCLKAIKF